MFPLYSPLFTSGLLAEHAPIPSSCSPATSPLEEPSSTIAQSPNASNNDGASAIYFTLQTGKRDTVELRSFLYLDLADHRHHAPSHRRRPSVLSKSTSWTCTVDVKSIHDLKRSEKSIAPTSLVPVVPTRRRTSKESLRSIPSPKPAPSITLPDPPIATRPPSSLPPSSKTCPVSTVVSPSLSSSRVRRLASLRSESASSCHRRKGRMDALACLEGRSRVPNRIPRPASLRNNFMSFSDDEDEKFMMRNSVAPSTTTSSPIQIEDPSSFADVEDEVDVIVPTLARARKPVGPAQLVRPAMPGRKRRSTLESWFPLKSFMDLKDDDLSSWNWRSFIEIGGAA